MYNESESAGSVLTEWFQVKSGLKQNRESTEEYLR